jgi:hypothetical protein
MKAAVAYLRVSTAQRQAVATFAAIHGFAIAGEHVEVETGKGADALEGTVKLLLRRLN